MSEPSSVQKQGDQWQSQHQGPRPAEKVQTTTADPGADGPSVFDLQDDESLEREAKRPDPRRTLPPDSNAL